MTFEVESALGALGLTFKNLVLGAFASFVGLKFWDGLTLWDRWTTFMGGAAIAAWGGPPLTVLLDLKPSVEPLVVLLLGLFGMAVSAELVRIVRETDWQGIIRSIAERFGGRKPPSDGDDK